MVGAGHHAGAGFDAEKRSVPGCWQAVFSRKTRGVEAGVASIRPAAKTNF
jgi:hypothetical protein